MSLAQIAERVALPRSTVHRIVTALEEERWVTSPRPEGYQLGGGLAQLATAADQNLIHRTLRPLLSDLRRTLDETVLIATLEDDQIALVDQLPVARPLRTEFAIDQPLPSYCTAPGKALLAQLEDQRLVARLPQPFEAFTTDTVRSRKALLLQIERIRLSGLAYDEGEYIEGIQGVAATIRDPLGRVVSLATILPSTRYPAKTKVIDRALLATRDDAEAALAAIFTDETPSKPG